MDSTKRLFMINQIMTPNYRRIFAGLILASATTVIVGCSSTADKYIESGSGYQLGLLDGQRGQEARSVALIQSYQTIEQSAYDDGYEQGIEDYCNPDHAYQIGLSGSDYQGVCESTPEGQKFRLEWQRGWRHYQINN